MITIFHGDNPAESRKAFFEFLGQTKNSDLLHLDSKSVDLNQINNFLNGGSLFPGTKILAIDNFFSITKSTLEKLTPLLVKGRVGGGLSVVIWQDKTLSAAQSKIFPQAKYFGFKADNRIFACLGSIKPHNLNTYDQLYDQLISHDFFDLFLYLLKSQLRRQLQGSSKYDPALIKKIYLLTIEMEFQYKTGQLSLPREIALKRVLVPLLK